MFNIKEMSKYQVEIDLTPMEGVLVADAAKKRLKKLR